MHGLLLFLNPESGKTPIPKLFLLDPNVRIMITSTTQRLGPKLKTRRRQNMSERGKSLITCQQNREIKPYRKIKQYKDIYTKTTNTTKGRQQDREINKKIEKAHRSRTSREPKMKGLLEAHCSGDTKKGLAVDGEQRTNTEKTSDAGHEYKHRQEKTKNKEPKTNREKARKEPKAGKMATREARPVQAGYRHKRGIGNSMGCGCVKRLGSGWRIGDTDQR
jgi:hypothetical protein